MEVVNALGRRKRAITRETLQSTFHQLFFSML